MSYYPNQPTYQGNARFSGGRDRRSENDSASPRRTKEENTRSRAPRLTNRVPPPVATPAYLIEQVCMVNKDLSNVPDKISAIADAIQNARNPQIERLLEDAIVRASSSISKTAKMDPLAPTPDWTHYAERLLTARKEALTRELATATANLQMTRGEANSISVSETTMRNDLLNKEIEESLEENTGSQHQLQQKHNLSKEKGRRLRVAIQATERPKIPGAQRSCRRHNRNQSQDRCRHRSHCPQRL